MDAPEQVRKLASVLGLLRVGGEIVAHQAAQLGIEIAGCRRQPGVAGGLKGAPLHLPIEAVGGGIDAVDAHCELLTGVPQDGDGLRGRFQRGAALPVSPLGQGLVEAQADVVWQGVHDCRCCSRAAVAVAPECQ